MKKVESIQICAIHGETRHFLDNQGYSRCYKCRSECVAKLRGKVKDKLLNLVGGKCEICGYFKAKQALDFHHLNPDEKSFSISYVTGTKSYDKILDELKKCVLLCANCHREIEAGVTDLQIDVQAYRSKLFDIIEKEKKEYELNKGGKTGKCKTCKNDFEIKYKGHKFCSVKCNSIGQRKYDLPPKEELEFYLKTNSIRATAKLYGVSHHTVHKWIDKLMVSVL